MATGAPGLIGISKDGLERTAQKTPVSFLPIGVLGDEHLGLLGALIEDYRRDANHPAAGQEVLEESRQLRREEAPEKDCNSMQDRCAPDIAREPRKYGQFFRSRYLALIVQLRLDRRRARMGWLINETGTSRL